MTTKDYQLQIITVDELPKTIRGMITDAADGRTIIAVNGKLTRSEQLAAFLHEAVHLFRGDLDRKDLTAAEIEDQARQDLADAMVHIMGE